MSNKILIGIFLLLAIAGVWLAVSKNQVNKDVSNPTPTNAQALQSGKDTEITTESNVQYFAESNGYFARPAAEGNYP